MAIQGEEWNEIDFVRRGYKTTKLVNPNHQGRANNLPFDFVDYNANKGVPCYLYEKTLLACFNNFGIYTREFLQNKDCSDANHWFTTCIRENSAQSIIKKYNPEQYITNRSSSPIYNTKDLLM